MREIICARRKGLSRLGAHCLYPRGPWKATDSSSLPRTGFSLATRYRLSPATWGSGLATREPSLLGTPDDGNSGEEQPFSTAERVLKLRGGFGPSRQGDD